MPEIVFYSDMIFRARKQINLVFILKEIHFKILIGALILTISSFHYLTPTFLRPLHELYKVIYFIPIILAAFAFGTRGGVIAALVVTVIYLPHVMFQWGGSFVMNISRFFMILLYNTLGALTGYLWEQEKKQRHYYQDASKQLKESLTKLEQTSDELKQIEGQLRAAERLSTLGELTASLAHEVRNPLGSIRGVAEILRDEPANEDHPKFVDILLKEVQRLDAVVGNYLSFARQKAVDKKPVALSSIIESTLALVAPEMRKKNLIVSRTIYPADLRLVCQEDQIRQAILNIILNAIQASPAHGKIHVGAEKQDHTILISIADEGPGLSKNAVKKLFEPFFTEKADGTGLGLAITKRIVRAHGGDIKAENRKNGGAIIIMEFPS